MIPLRNAVLTSVTAVGTTADYDTPAVAGAARWTGVEGIYVAEEIVEALTNGRLDEVKKTRLEIPYSPVGKLVQRDDVLTYTYEGATQTRVAGTITHAALVGRVRILTEHA